MNDLGEGRTEVTMAAGVTPLAGRFSQGSYTLKLQNSRLFKAISLKNSRPFLATRHTNYRMTAPPSGLVRSSRDHGRMKRYLRDVTFTHTISMPFDMIFTHFDTLLMP